MLFVDNKGSWDGSLVSVFGSDRKYWPQGMTNALGLNHDGGFPFQLTLNTINNNWSLTQRTRVPAVDFPENINKSMQVGDVLNKERRIYVTPTEFFTTKFRQILKDTQITSTTSAYGRKWLGVPDMSFWPQQLNFALWCELYYFPPPPPLPPPPPTQV